jgi:hypothetical protein
MQLLHRALRGSKNKAHQEFFLLLFLPLPSVVHAKMEEEELPQREQTLKKLLVKICMRAEVERFRVDPTCWRDGEANPLLHRSLCALRTCPLLLVADNDDDVLQQCLSALPLLADQLKAIEGGDLLITLANDLGNFWQLMLVTEDEEPSDMALFDDLVEEQEEEQEAKARALREQSMRSFKAALGDIGRMSGGFDEAYHMIVGATSVEEVAPPSVQLAIVHAFDAMDFAITHAVLADDVRRKDFKRKAKQLSNPLLGPLLNAANPFRLLPSFARFAIRTGIAERLALRSARQKLSEAQRAVPDAVAQLILEHVEQGKANMPVAQLKAAHVQHIVGCTQEEDDESALLHMLKHAALVWQKRQMMQLMRRAEFAFFLDHIVPLLGTPLAALYEELRIGDEIRNIGVLLQNVARRTPQALPNLRARLFAYITTTLRHPGSHKLQQLLSWLFENLSQPQTISLRALVAQHQEQAHAAALWAEVDEARARLMRGEHFQDLALPLVRLLAPHFHAALRVDAP